MAVVVPNEDALDAFHVAHGMREDVYHASFKIVLRVIELYLWRADGGSVPILCMC